MFVAREVIALTSLKPFPPLLQNSEISPMILTPVSWCSCCNTLRKTKCSPTNGLNLGVGIFWHVWIWITCLCLLLPPYQLSKSIIFKSHHTRSPGVRLSRIILSAFATAIPSAQPVGHAPSGNPTKACPSANDIYCTLCLLCCSKRRTNSESSKYNIRTLFRSEFNWPK